MGEQFQFPRLGHHVVVQGGRAPAGDDDLGLGNMPEQEILVRLPGGLIRDFLAGSGDPFLVAR